MVKQIKMKTKIIYLSLIIGMMQSCNDESSSNNTSKVEKYEYLGYKRYINEDRGIYVMEFTIDSHQYLTFGTNAIIHKINCNNTNHSNQK